MKIANFIAIACLLTANAVQANCMANGQLYLLGSIISVDKDNLLTQQWHEQFKQINGVYPDGGAYKMALCTYLVYPESKDFPYQKQRQYVWVAAPMNINQTHY